MRAGLLVLVAGCFDPSPTAGAPWRFSTKSGNTYSTPVPVTDVNTTARDGCPFVPQANDVSYFERAGDLYSTSR